MVIKPYGDVSPSGRSAIFASLASIR